VLADPNPYHRARAIWVLARLGAPGEEAVARLLDDRDPQMRITAFRALRHVRRSVLDEIRKLASDSSSAVRREAAVALQGIPFARSEQILLTLASGYDGTDRWYLEALGLASFGHEDAFYRALIPVLGHPDPLAWSPRFANIVWRLHPASAVDALRVRAGGEGLPPAARAQAIVALGFIDDRRAAQAMADLTHSANREVAAQASWWMTFRKANDWRAYPVDGWLTAGPDDSPAHIEGMNRLHALVTDDSAPIDRRIVAALTMARTPVGARLLIHLASANRLAYQLREAASSVIFSNPDRAVRTIATGYFQRPGGALRMAAADAGSRKGDGARGEARFAAACATCHRFGETGADIGPDLTAIRDKFDRTGLIDAIVNPGAAIAFGYAAELFVTSANDAHIGFLRADGSTITIRDGYGRRVSIDRAVLTARVPLEQSLMPDPLALALAEQDIADITAFLMKEEP
jgi:putative heme-binding domain-containing protein